MSTDRILVEPGLTNRPDTETVQTLNSIFGYGSMTGILQLYLSVTIMSLRGKGLLKKTSLFLMTIFRYNVFRQSGDFRSFTFEKIEVTS